VPRHSSPGKRPSKPPGCRSSALDEKQLSALHGKQRFTIRRVRRLLPSLAVTALLFVGCGSGEDGTTSAAQGIAALANKVGGPLKVADTYARSKAEGQATDCRLGSSSETMRADCIYGAALAGCLKALRKSHKEGTYALLYSRDGNLNSREGPVYRQAVQDCSHL
jgi:hypothetical protein